jgi:hypothetical protein
MALRKEASLSLEAEGEGQQGACSALLATNVDGLAVDSTRGPTRMDSAAARMRMCCITWLMSQAGFP